MTCKHRLNLMTGDTTRLVSSNTDDVALLTNLIAGSLLEASYLRLQEAEEAVAAAKNDLKAAQKALSKVMHG